MSGIAARQCVEELQRLDLGVEHDVAAAGEYDLAAVAGDDPLHRVCDTFAVLVGRGVQGRRHRGARKRWCACQRRRVDVQDFGHHQRGGVGEVEGDRAGQTVDGPGAQGGRGGVDVGERTDRAHAPHGAVRAGQHEHISR